MVGLALAMVARAGAAAAHAADQSGLVVRQPRQLQHSYGRQIGRLLDAVSALVERLPAAASDPRVKEFQSLVREVDGIKRRARLPRVERLRDEIEELQRSDPRAYDKLRAMLSR
jgi:hypothetical protein